MGRHKAILAAVALVTGVGMAPPASAAVQQCAGTGSAELSTGIRYYPDITLNVGFTFSFQCADGSGTLTGSGLLTTASCGRSSGSGTITGIGDIAVETVGSMLIITGAANGGGNATPIPDASTIPPGNTCSSGTAKIFQLMGGAIAVS